MVVVCLDICICGSGLSGYVYDMCSVLSGYVYDICSGLRICL